MGSSFLLEEYCTASLSTRKKTDVKFATETALEVVGALNIASAFVFVTPGKSIYCIGTIKVEMV